MKKLFKLILILIILGGGYLYYDYSTSSEPIFDDLKEMAEEKISNVSSVGSRARIRPDDIFVKKSADPIEDYCHGMGGEIREHGGDDNIPLQDICFINDGMDGIICNSELFYKRECGHRNKEKSVQEFMVRKRGIPEVYMIIFNRSKLTKTGVEPADDVRRLDTWTYGSPHNVVASFDNGFFQEEKEIGSEQGLREIDLSPLFFNENTMMGHVERHFGVPTCVVEEELGGSKMKTLRYAETDDNPVASIMFEDEMLVGVEVGLVHTGGTGQLCPSN